jgi:hypothetical protein
MKKLLILLAAVFLMGCEQPAGYSPIRITTNHSSGGSSNPGNNGNGKNQGEVPEVEKMLEPIDEDIVYIWDFENNRAYFADDLPDGEGDMAPHPFLFTDGTVADVVGFEYYRPDRHFYLKVRCFEEVKTDGITTGWNEVYRIFRQKKYKMEEAPKDTVFPAYEPVNIEDYKFAYGYVGKNRPGYPTLFPSDPHGIKYGFCSPEFKNFTMFHTSGDTEWMIGEKLDIDHPQLFTIDHINVTPRCWIWYAKAVFKP